ncbi:L,D-transpeptidase family protein [Pseudomonas sp. NPDC087612]|uniref:L,D-transpeptidase n=1 Tax=Pseudomonas TaxID=286 RepID=UPI0005EBBA02|nr:MULTISPECIES: L,D-transpeptidase [unclassified Pseudomonas]KJK19296.1 ErfK/YbiS/YcfS/YnhG family protein [Pseudomonas sp. 2(2015)]QPG62882.1 L,D-transpeptidase [Pseudomonas sp. BIGb0427]UVM65329.1 L,D-transpeptidase [Pseudomonas sp. B21-009]SDQ54168.1 L,D-transpeptidase catalytic domain [Pseudomonas sp. UC 17F4]
MASLDFLHISLADQCLYGFAQGQLRLRLEISTARNGAGELNGSGCTPRGRHQVRAKIGAGLPQGAVLRGRRWTGETWSAELHEQFPGRDWILTRILWLSGCEPGVNRLGSVDTFRRYIYLHGTPDSEPMGVPLSHGCVRLRNADLLSLFDQVPVHCPVQIDEAACPQWAHISVN